MIDFRNLPMPTLAGEPITCDPLRNGSVSRRGTRDRVSDHYQDEPQVPVFVTERQSMIEAKEVEWLWPNRFPMGMASVIAGDPGGGKSTVVIDMAARITTGVAWPDDRDGTNPVGNVLIVTGEDSIAHTVRPRLDNAKGDPARIHILRGVRQPRGDHLIPLDLDSHARHLVGFLESHPEIRMVAIDPLDAFMGSDTDTHKKSEVQRILHGVAELAEACNVAIVGVLHLRKNSNDKAIYRVLGSTGFVSAPRAVRAIERDRNDRGRRIMTAMKVTNANEPTGLGFRIIDTGVIAW